MNATRTRNTKSAASARGARGRSQGKGSQSRGLAAKKTNRKQSRGASTQGRGRGGASSGASSTRKGASAPRGRASKSGGTSRGSRTPVGQAIEILLADHKMVQQMFRQAERAKDDPRQLREIVEAACAALTLHTEIEEQHFYPQMREAIDDAGMIAEAYIEHASAKQLISELQGGEPEDEDYAARFKVLGEYVKHHIKEEENEIFPKARRARADFEPLLEALVARDEAVMAEGAKEGQTAAGGKSGGGRSRRGAAAASQASGARSRGGAGDESSPSSSSRGASDTSGRSGARGRQGRGREGAGEGAADTATQGVARTGGTEGEADMEQPRRSRGSRTQQDTGDLESASHERESESEEATTRGSTPSGR